MAARNRDEHEVLVVSAGDRNPAQRRVLCWPRTRTWNRAPSPLARCVHRGAAAVVCEGLARPGRRRPPRVRLDLARRPTPGAPRREHDVHRIGAVRDRRRTRAVRIEIGRRSARERGQPRRPRQPRPLRRVRIEPCLDGRGTPAEPCANLCQFGRRDPAAARRAGVTCVVRSRSCRASTLLGPPSGWPPRAVGTRSSMSRPDSRSASTCSSLQSPTARRRMRSTRSTSCSTARATSRSRRATARPEGDAVFVAARADHRFSGYESLSLLVVFNGPHSASKRA